MLDFDNLKEYIEQVYRVRMDQSFLEKEAPALTYLKLVRVLSFLRIQPVGMTAEEIFADAVREERNWGGNSPSPETRTVLLYQLADLHEIIELLIRKSEVKKNDSFSAELWSNDINS
ncbi:hypothetical protein MZD04_gp367 [Pseudomonas phage Psa21]|uniref:Uncharacterized protein n=1 Tax=Pseudomonas phage Psa21 TaxID=2530023 RepID=A0A481W675_9CAUD|nr:hypothetical protein MZD04_gp367 [Pseudomonas phage Psa21]QBJ02893.1 hypothetical protein PSA21_367 [Pseudomonas phage Psa21]